MTRDTCPEHADDDVAEPPADRRDRRGFGRRSGEFDHIVARTALQWRGRGATRPQAPTAAHRFPEILIIGQTIEPGPQLRRPVPVDLVDDLCGHLHVINSFLRTLPIAFRGNASTRRTSRGRLCTESCCATKPITSSSATSPTT
ncbi:Uncharacterised protein [Mycobacteroides abscessus subsp. abscessus]|nr:Uncharacterised protein [Mycobacteroides abscessus subsp. abscessus]